MNFAVDWTEMALAQLAAIWNDSSDRNGVTAASYRVEALLQNDPFNKGEAREDNYRIVFDPPLGVVFRAIEGERVVIVVSIGPSRLAR